MPRKPVLTGIIDTMPSLFATDLCASWAEHDIAVHREAVRLTVCQHCSSRLHLDGALVQPRLADDAHEEIVSKRPQTAHRPHVVKVATVLCTTMWFPS